MYLYSVNTYKCISKPTVVSTLTINNWFDQIKQSDYSEQIAQAREGLLAYETTKASLPCVTYNFLYNEYKTDANVSSSTGLMYIDIDNPTFDISTVDSEKIYAYYKSFGGSGYAIIVKVVGLTIDNFKSSYLSIVSDLGLMEYIDKQAIKASQFNVLSYDKDLYVNYDSYTYSGISTPSIVIEKGKRAYTIGGVESYKPLRFDDLDRISIEGDYVVNWEGYQWIKCFIPIKKIKKNRNNFLLSYCTNLVYLNPEISFQKTLEVIGSVNKRACETPVEENQLKRVVSSIHKYHAEGNLKPIYFNKLRKIVFGKNCKLDRLEKLDICRGEMIIRWANISQNKIYDIIEAWNFEVLGPIGQTKMHQNYPISKKTVEKYWHHFKAHVKYINQRYKQKQVLYCKV